MNPGLISAMERKIDTLLATYATQTSEQVALLLGSVALAGLTLHYLLLGLSFARGDNAESLARLLKDALGQVLVCLVVLGGAYQGVVIGFVGALQGDLVSAVTRSDARTVGEALDQLFTDQSIDVKDARQDTTSKAPMVTALFVAAWNDASWVGIPNLTYALSGLLVAIAFILVCLLCLLPALLAKIGLSLMLAIGPVFVLMLLWPATRNHFSSWLAATLGFVLTTALATMVGTLTREVFMAAMAQGLQGVGTKDFNPIGVGVAMLVVGAGLALTALHVSQLGAQLAGGGIAMDGRGQGAAALHQAGTTLGRLLNPKGPAGGPPPDRGPSAAPGGTNATAAMPTPSDRLRSIVSGLQNRNRPQ